MPQLLENTQKTNDGVISMKSKLGSFDLWGSYVIAGPFALAHNIPVFLYFTIAGKINLMIRFKSKGHGFKNRYVLLNGRYLLAS